MVCLFAMLHKVLATAWEVLLNIANKHTIRVISRSVEPTTGHRYRRIEDQKPGPGLASNLSFAKEKGLEPKV